MFNMLVGIMYMMLFAWFYCGKVTSYEWVNKKTGGLGTKASVIEETNGWTEVYVPRRQAID
jgi:hypothetical protein